MKTCRFQNPDIPRVGRVGAHGGTTRRGRAGLDANKTVRPGDLSSPKPRHTSGGSGRVGAQGAAGRKPSRTGCQPNCSPKRQGSILTSVIEHKRCPTGKRSQRRNQSQNRPVQNTNTSHAAEACRLRASRRVEYASADASGARRRTCRLRARRRAGLRVGRRAGLRVGRRAGLRVGRRAG